MSHRLLVSTTQRLVNKALQESTSQGFDSFDVELNGVTVGQVQFPFANHWKINPDKGQVTISFKLAYVSGDEETHSAIEDFVTKNSIKLSLSSQDRFSNFHPLAHALPAILSSNKKFCTLVAECFADYYEGWYREEIDNLDRSIPSSIKKSVLSSGLKIVPSQYVAPKQSDHGTMTLQASPQLTKFLTYFMEN